MKKVAAILILIFILSCGSGTRNLETENIDLKNKLDTLERQNLDLNEKINDLLRQNQDLQEKLKLTYLFVANSLNVLHHISNRIAILDHGRIVEIQKTSNLFEKPKEEVTKNLLGAMLSFYQ